MSGRDHELIAAEVWVLGYFVGIDVDELHDPVGIGAAGGGDEIRDGLSADVHRLGRAIGQM